MGVNITVNFSLPQQIAFAGAIESYSNAQVSYRTQMDGRVDDPIGEELKAAGVADWEEVKRWATTAIRQREYRMLCLPPTRAGWASRSPSLFRPPAAAPGTSCARSPTARCRSSSLSSRTARTSSTPSQGS